MLGIGSEIAPKLPADPRGLVLEIWLAAKGKCAQQARIIDPQPQVPLVDVFDVRPICERMWGVQERQVKLEAFDPDKPVDLDTLPPELPIGPRGGGRAGAGPADRLTPEQQRELQGYIAANYPPPPKEQRERRRSNG